MNYRLGRGQRLCATCEYWTGPRQADYFGNAVILPAQSISGNCWCLSGPHARATRLSNYTACTYYEHWALLK